MTYEVKTRIVHDTSGLYSQGDVTDRPCPTITIGVNGLNSAHYQVEYYKTDAPPSTDSNMALWLNHHNASGFDGNTVKRLCRDTNASPAIMAGGIWGDNTSHYWLEDDGLNTYMRDTSKPPYRVPSMAEIGAIPWNGFTAVSTFSGCGGSSLGYKMAGFKVLWANEFIPAAQEVYRLNHPNTILDTRDIRQVKAQDILDAIGMQPGELDLFDGSPPCASFSTAGKREAGWGKVKNYSDTKQRTDDLFFEYARLVKGIQPRVFVAENVSGLVKGTAKGYFKLILQELKNCGYNVKAKVLDAQWLGVPQMRQRLIFIGVRNDLGVEPAFPKPLSYQYTVRDALPWIVTIGTSNGFGHSEQVPASQPYDTVGTGPQQGNGLARFIEAMPRAYRDKRGAYGNDGDITDQPAPTVLSDSVGTHWVTGLSTFDGERSLDAPAPTVLTPVRQHTNNELMFIEAETSIDGYAIGRECVPLAPGEQSDKYFQLVKPSLEAPSPTVTQRGGDNTVASVTHPTEKRKFSIAELKRICAFPDDFQLTGTYAQQWERLGRAVPPVMMSYIASTVRDEVLAKCAE